MPWPPPAHEISSLDLDQKIRALIPLARSHKEGVAAARAGLRQLDDHPDSEWEWVKTAAIYGGMAASWRRCFRRYLIQRFGIDPLRRRVVRAVPPESRPPLHCYADAVATFFAYDRVFTRMNHEGEKGEASGASPKQAAKTAISTFLEEIERAFAGPAAAMTAPLDDSYREGKTVMVSAAIAARLSLSKNRRLADALANKEDSLFDELLRQLPGAVLVAWDERQEDEDPINRPSATSVFMVIRVSLRTAVSSSIKRLRTPCSASSRHT